MKICLYIFILIIQSSSYAQTDSCFNEESQVYEYSSEKIEISISSNNKSVCQDDIISIIISVKNISSQNIYIFDHNSVLCGEASDIILIDQGGSYGNSGLIVMEVKMTKLAPNKETNINYEFSYDQLKSHFEDNFRIVYSFGFLPDINKYKMFLDEITYDKFPLEIFEDFIMVSSYPLEIFLEKHSADLRFLLL